MNRGSFLLLAGGLVACGLSLSEPLRNDDVGDGGGSSGASGSGGSTSSGGASGSGGTSNGGSVSPIDASTDALTMGTLDATVPPPQPDAGLCNGRPTPNYPANGKCYWLSMSSTEDKQAAACSTGAQPGVPFQPADYGDLLIPSQLSREDANAFVWLNARFVRNGVASTVWKFQPSGNTFTLLVDHGSGEDCLRTRYFSFYPNFQFDSVKCDDAALKVVCQSR
jgi:hypothetical protein